MVPQVFPFDAVHATWSWPTPLPLVTDRFVGVVGARRGVTLFTGPDGVLLFSALVAVTVRLYAEQLTRPVMVALMVELALMLHGGFEKGALQVTGMTVEPVLALATGLVIVGAPGKLGGASGTGGASGGGASMGGGGASAGGRMVPRLAPAAAQCKRFCSHGS